MALLAELNNELMNLLKRSLWLPRDRKWIAGRSISSSFRRKAVWGSKQPRSQSSAAAQLGRPERLLTLFLAFMAPCISFTTVFTS